jgi:hypothetical protein
MRVHHPVTRRKARLAAGVLCLCLSGGLSACGVSTDVYTRTLHERDQLRDRLGQAEAESAAQRRQAGDLRTVLTEQRHANHTLQARVTELETLTADQNLTQEALAQQLRSLTAEREELLLRLDESKPSPSGPPATASEEADAKRLTGALHDMTEAGHVMVRPFAHGLDLRLAESFLFVSDKTALTADGQRMLSTMERVLSGMRLRRLQLRMPLPAVVVGGASEQAQDGRATAFNRLLALARQLGGGAESSELVLVTRREGTPPHPAVSSPPEQAIPAGEIQVLLEWMGEP